MAEDNNLALIANEPNYGTDCYCYLQIISKCRCSLENDTNTCYKLNNKKCPGKILQDF